MKVIGIHVASRESGQFVLEALKTAVDRGRVTLEDVAFVTKDDAGRSTFTRRRTSQPARARGAARSSVRSSGSRRRLCLGLPPSAPASARCGGSSATVVLTTI